MKKIFFLVLVIMFTFELTGIALAANWAGPSGIPPTQNKEPPVNISLDRQIKQGQLEAGKYFPWPGGSNPVPDVPGVTYGLLTPSRIVGGAFCFWTEANRAFDCKNSWSEIVGGGGSFWEEIRSGWIQPKSASSPKGVTAKYGFILETRSSNPPSVTSADAGRMWLCTGTDAQIAANCPTN
ncbi:MAG: hypothetical protein HZB12_02010 [Candidatus Yonathbacteria bacterium]|nr:hypothetical protein [Candidatus Yonathbacteria bacterium]